MARSLYPFHCIERKIWRTVMAELAARTEVLRPRKKNDFEVRVRGRNGGPGVVPVRVLSAMAFTETLRKLSRDPDFWRHPYLRSNGQRGRLDTPQPVRIGLQSESTQRRGCPARLFRR